MAHASITEPPPVPPPTVTLEMSKEQAVLILFLLGKVNDTPHDGQADAYEALLEVLGWNATDGYRLTAGLFGGARVCDVDYLTVQRR